MPRALKTTETKLTRNHYRPCITKSRWLLTNAVQANGKLVTGALLLIKTARHIPGACPISNPQAILRSLRAEYLPVGIQIEHVPQVDTMLPARYARRFDTAKFDLRWHEHEPFFRPVRRDGGTAWADEVAAHAESRAWEW